MATVLRPTNPNKKAYHAMEWKVDLHCESSLTFYQIFLPYDNFVIGVPNVIEFRINI